jgi:hypothetical protein
MGRAIEVLINVYGPPSKHGAGIFVPDPTQSAGHYASFYSHNQPENIAPNIGNVLDVMIYDNTIYIHGVDGSIHVEIKR